MTEQEKKDWSDLFLQCILQSVFVLLFFLPVFAVSLGISLRLFLWIARG